MAISRPLGATSRVIFELKPFGVSIMGANGSQPWVGRSTVQMSGNPIIHAQLSIVHDDIRHEFSLELNLDTIIAGP